MSAIIWLVDYENIQKFDPANVPRDVLLKVFIGSRQARVHSALIKNGIARKDHFELIFIEGSASNALDFHIACHLGECLAQFPQTEFVILSNDKGFDPLITHLRSRGIKCRRDGQGSTVKAAVKPAAESPAAQVLEHLRAMEKTKRPRKRQPLINYLATHFKKRLSEAQVTAAIDQLVKLKQLQESATGLVYLLT